jgi:hypothetical protein
MLQMGNTLKLTEAKEEMCSLLPLTASAQLVPVVHVMAEALQPHISSLCHSWLHSLSCKPLPPYDQGREGNEICPSLPHFTNCDPEERKRIG